MARGSTALDHGDSAMADVHVRIAEVAVARPHDGRLVAVGLGSCVGVAVFDEASGAVGLAHVFLPDPGAAGAKPGAAMGTYACTAIPDLERRVGALARMSNPRPRLKAAIAGGAKMFAHSSRSAEGASGTDVGERNVGCVRAALSAARIEIVGEVVGGTSGRTLRVDPGTCAIVVKQVGQPEQIVWSGRVPHKSARAAAPVGEVRIADRRSAA